MENNNIEKKNARKLVVHNLWIKKPPFLNYIQ